MLTPSKIRLDVALDAFIRIWIYASQECVIRSGKFFWLFAYVIQNV